jgi:hypothetical protein
MFQPLADRFAGRPHRNQGASYLRNGGCKGRVGSKRRRTDLRRGASKPRGGLNEFKNGLAAQMISMPAIAAGSVGVEVEDRVVVDRTGL